jgi:hypothetical protein
MNIDPVFILLLVLAVVGVGFVVIGGRKKSNPPDGPGANGSGGRQTRND